MASRITLLESQSVPDIMSSENFRLLLGSIPNSGGDSNMLSIKCQNCSIPNRESAAFEVSLGGYYRTFRGQTRTTNMMQATFVEDVNMGTLSLLRDWFEGVNGTDTNTAIGNVSDYSVDAELSIFDQAGNEVDVVSYYNFYIIGLAEIPLEVNGSQVMLVQATFRHDAVKYAITTTR